MLVTDIYFYCFAEYNPLFLPKRKGIYIFLQKKRYIFIRLFYKMWCCDAFAVTLVFQILVFISMLMKAHI